MAMFVFTSGGTAPGATTSLAALASVWPAPVVIADCDPAGGQILAGWLASWTVEGAVRLDRGLLSFVMATRHAPRGEAGVLAQYLQPVPDHGSLRVLGGLRDASQASSLDESSWRRLAQALTDPTLAVGGAPADVLVDVGRVGLSAPWPLLAAADAVVVATRRTLRSVLAARSALTVMNGAVDPARLGLLVCASRTGDAHELRRTLGVPVRAEVAADRRVAPVFSEGAQPPRGASTSPLVRSARTAARRLHGLTERVGAGNVVIEQGVRA